MKKNFDDFTTQIQSDELASLGAQDGSDWVNDFEQQETDDEYYDD